MKKLAVLVLTVLSSRAYAADLSINLHGLNGAKGDLLVRLFNKEEGFPKDTKKAMRFVVESIKDGEKEKAILVNDLEPGDYAISVVHDEDGDGKLKRNWIGMPSEGFGFSKDATGFMGPPSFEKSVISLVPGKNEIRIRIKYL